MGLQDVGFVVPQVRMGMSCKDGLSGLTMSEPGAVARQRVWCRAVVASVALAALTLHGSPACGQSLGSAASFAILGGTGVTAAGTGSIITGDVGVSPGTSLIGFGTAAVVVPPVSYTHLTLPTNREV